METDLVNTVISCHTLPAAYFSIKCKAVQGKCLWELLELQQPVWCCASMQRQKLDGSRNAADDAAKWLLGNTLYTLEADLKHT